MILLSKCGLAVGVAGLVTMLSGCASSDPSASRAARGAGAVSGEICHVCKYNNDLACVCVTVDAQTPRTDYQGHTYYFCSDDCKAAFLKKPEKYLRRQ